MSRHLSRFLIALSILAVGVGAGLQHRWDAQCDQVIRGAHWNGDDWMCEGPR